MGQKVLGAFMSELSKSCELSQIYTNHSIRATGATVLSKGRFGAAQIMAVTGHKSVQSLSVYQRVHDEEKIQMGKTLSESLVPS
jgi:integrase